MNYESKLLLLLLLFTPLGVFTSVLADGFSLEFEWQQVFSNLQDSSQDSGSSHLVSFFGFNGISTLLRLFNAKAILLEEQ